jgi:uncharacterized protein involved in exopolysaccharide biosynthesis
MQRQSDDPHTPHVFTNWELFEPLKRHKSFILVFTLSAALSALALTYIYSEKYEGETTILFKPTEVSRLRDQDYTEEAFGAPLPQAEYKVIGKTIEDLTSSKALLEPVVTKLKLDVPDSRVYTGPFYYVWYKEAKDYVNDEAKDVWSFLKYGRVIEKTNLEAAIGTLKDDITIDNKDSYVFDLKVRDKHQERVAAVTNTVADELVLLLQRNEQQRASLRSTEIQRLMDAKRAEISSFQKGIADTLNSNGVVSVSQETEKDVYRYSELALAEQNTEADLHNAEATLQSYDQRLGEQSASASDANGAHRGLQADDFKRLSSERLEAQVTLAGLNAKRASLDASLRELSATTQRLASLQVTNDNLSNRVEQSQRDYALLTDAYQEALLQEQQNPANLAIQSRAIEPTAPAEPVKLYHISLAASLAVLLSVGLSFVFGFFNIRFFIPSKGVKGRRSATSDSREQHESLSAAGE